jgi:hypothetical protein
LLCCSYTHARSRGKDLSAVGVTVIAGPHRLSFFLSFFFFFFFLFLFSFSLSLSPSPFFPGVIYPLGRERERETPAKEE